jgi:hypothetical protein
MRIAIVLTLLSAPLWAQLASNAPADLTSGRVQPPTELKDFSIVLDLTTNAGAQSWLDVPGLKLTHTGTAVRAEVAGGIMEAPVDTKQPHTVALVVKRDQRQALSGLWLDGVEVRSASVPPGSVKLDSAPAALTLYSRPLTRPEVIARSQITSAPQGWAIVGGSEAVALVESGYLEAYWMPKEPVRSLAWEGDTVFHQDRPLNFGTLQDQIRRVQPKGLIVMFGRQECLERGAEGLVDFIQAMKHWPVPAIIVGPLPFEKKPAPQRDLSALNPVIAAYNEALSKLPSTQFIDVTSAATPGFTRDGVTLTDLGCQSLARTIAKALGSRLDQTDAKALQLIREKNRLWHQYWRPANWAFLYGDRTAQPSSRDHLDPKIRWFPGELEQYRQLIAAKEQALWNLQPSLP